MLPLRFLRLRCWAAIIAGLFAWLCVTVADGQTPARLGAGATFDSLPAGKTTYQHVQVRSVNARTMMISHAGGIASVRLRDLSPELQAAFGYDPAAESSTNPACFAPFKTQASAPSDSPRISPPPPTDPCTPGNHFS